MRLEGVGRRYGVTSPWVLRDVDLTVPERAALRVEGVNGSGKSTLLRLLAGIDAPSAGRITGRPSCAYVPERFPAALPMTALGYLAHLGRVHGLARATARHEATDWLERFGAGGWARTQMSELSKGTCQKVALTQALVARPRLLLLDEAWTGLDRDARAVLDQAVAERVADGGTVIFVDHDPRRLPWASAYRVTGSQVTDVPRERTPSERTVPVRIEAEALGIAPPARPPAQPPETAQELRPDGTLVLTVPGGGSDAALRTLLSAGWHIRAVRGLRDTGDVAARDSRGTAAQPPPEWSNGQEGSGR